MASFIRLGMHVELVKTGIKLDSPEAVDNKFASSIHDIDDDDECIILTNPTQKARLIPMHPGERYDAYFYSKDNKIYTARVTVSKNLTDGGIRVVRFSLNSDIEKYERRQFFRLETTMDIRYLLLTAQNAETFRNAVKSNTLLQMEGFKKGTTIDISGGGIKFTADESLPENSLCIMHIEAVVEDKKKNYIFVGKILQASPKVGKRGVFEHRTQFVDLKQDAREELVHFIFHKERDSLKRRI